MARDFAKQFYSSIKWQNCRNAYASSKHYLCERCLEKGLYHKGAIVHHKTYIDDDNLDDDSITLNFDNLELLCRSCHELEHKGKQKRYSITESGEVVF